MSSRAPLTRAEVIIGALLVTAGLAAIAVSARRPAAPAIDAAPARLDLNLATQDELALLAGVGPALAERLVRARPFGAVGDARPVLGDELFARVEPHLVVEAAGLAPVTTSR